MAKEVKEEPNDKPFKNRSTGTDIAVLRAKIGRIVRLVLVFFAIVLALGALLVALRQNVSEDNTLVKFVLNFADAIDGPFGKDNGIFAFAGENAETKNALVNWGIAAIVYLVIGNILERLIAGRRRG